MSLFLWNILFTAFISLSFSIHFSISSSFHFSFPAPYLVLHFSSAISLCYLLMFSSIIRLLCSCTSLASAFPLPFLSTCPLINSSSKSDNHPLILLALAWSDPWSDIVCRRFKPPIWLIFFPTLPPLLLLTTFFWHYSPSEIEDRHKNKPMKESYIFMFRKLKNSITCFFL